MPAGGENGVFARLDHEPSAMRGSIAVARRARSGVLGLQRQERALEACKILLAHALDQRGHRYAALAQQLAKVRCGDWRQRPPDLPKLGLIDRTRRAAVQ
jgi:hypothetical protein